MITGYNIHNEDNDLKGHLRIINPSTILVLENYGLAHDLAVALPKTMIIYRPYYPQTDAYHTLMRPYEFVAKMRQLWKGEPNIWFHTGNESGISHEQSRWEMALDASPAGMKFVVGNYATGTTPDSNEEWEDLDYFIEFLGKRKGKFMLGIHEYFDGIPCITMPNFASRVHDWGDGLIFPAWHTNRFQWLLNYCDEVGLAYPDIVLTEHGNDDVREGRDNSPVNAFLDQLVVEQGYYNIRGWKTLRTQWRNWYQKDAEDVYFEMIEWLRNNVYNHPAIKGTCLYAWCGDAGQWGQFNLSRAMTFRRRMEEKFRNHSIWVDVMVITSHVSIMRSAPSTSATRLGTVTAGTRLQLNSEDFVTGWGDATGWYHVRTVDGRDGYIRKDVVDFELWKLRETKISTATYGVNVRQGNSTSSPIVAKLLPNKPFVFMGREADGWAMIDVGGTVGWVSLSVLKYK